MDTFFFSRTEGMRPGTVKLGLQVQYATGGESMKNAVGGGPTDTQEWGHIELEEEEERKKMLMG